MTDKRLTPQNATVTTATIQVQALTIGKKQVTLAVFRQLEDEDIIKPLDASLEGEPWGRVNYHPDKCADQKEHIHVVWQKGDELRRATVYEPSVAAHRTPYAGLYAQALIADGRRHHVEDRPADHLQVVAGSGYEPGFARFTYRGVHFHGPVRAAVACAARMATLYAALPPALASKRGLDRDGCGPACRGRHQVIALDPGPRNAGAAA